MSTRDAAIEALRSSGAAAALTGVGTALGLPAVKAAGAGLALADSGAVPAVARRTREGVPSAARQVREVLPLLTTDDEWEQFQREAGLKPAGDLSDDAEWARFQRENGLAPVEPAPTAAAPTTTDVVEMEPVGLPEESLPSAKMVSSPGDKIVGAIRGLGLGLVDSFDSGSDRFEKARQAGRQATKETIDRRRDQHMVSNVLEDIYDVTSALPRLGMSVFEEEPEGVDVKARAEEAGRQVPGAVIGMYETAYDDPAGYVRAMPVSTALDLIPATKMVARGAQAVAPGLRAAKLPGAAGLVEKQAARLAPLDEAVEAARAADVDADVALRRAAANPATTARQEASAFADKLGAEADLEIARGELAEAAKAPDEGNALVRAIRKATAWPRRVFSDPAAQPTRAAEAVAAQAINPLEAVPSDVLASYRFQRDVLERAPQFSATPSEVGERFSKVDELTMPFLQDESVKRSLAAELRKIPGTFSPTDVVRRLSLGDSVPVPPESMQAALDAVHARRMSLTPQDELIKTRRELLQLPEDHTGPVRYVGRSEARELAGVNRMDPGLAKSVLPQIMEEVGKEPGPVTDFLRVVKGNLVANNPSSIINNFMSNVLLQALRRGPIDTGARVLGRGMKLALEAATDKGPYRNVFKQLEDLKILDRDALTADVQRVAPDFSRLSSKTPADLAQFLAEYGGVLPKAFKMGDRLFKLEDTIHTLNTYRELLGELGQGEFVELRMTPRFVFRVDRKGDDLVGHVYHKGGARVSDRPIYVSTDLDNVTPELLRAAAQPGLDAFFDYADIPNYPKAVRNNELTAIASPFLIWAYKALDFPGLKRGLAYEAFVQPSGILNTNSRAARRAQAKTAAAGLLGRATVLAAAREQMMEETGGAGRALASAFSYVPTEPRIALIRAITNPGNTAGQALVDGDYAYVPTGGNWNFLQPTERLFRLGAAAYHKIYGDDLADLYRQFDQLGLTAEQKRDLRRRIDLTQKAESNQLTSATDLPELLGFGGNMLVEALDEFSDAKDKNRPVDTAKIIKSIALPLIGAGPAFQAATNYLVPESSFADSSMLELNPKLREDVTRAFVRRLLGMSWRTVPLFNSEDPKEFGKVDGYFRKMQQALENSTGANTASLAKLRTKAEQLRKAGKIEEANKVLDRAETLELVVKPILAQEIELARTNWIQSLTKIQQSAIKRARK